MAGPPLLPPALGLVAVGILGIDEAGRGALLGPMVVAAVLVGEESIPRLRALGAADSKSIPRERRKPLLAELLPLALGARAVAISPAEIDARGLTELELSAAARLISRLAPERAVLDAPVAPRAIPGFASRLREELRRLGAEPPEITIVPKADRDHVPVGIASLLAKVTRDSYVTWLRRLYGDFGWGYPGEPRVREFLRRWWEDHRSLPPICRRRWKAVGRILGPSLGI